MKYVRFCIVKENETTDDIVHIETTFSHFTQDAYLIKVTLITICRNDGTRNASVEQTAGLAGDKAGRRRETLNT